MHFAVVVEWNGTASRELENTHTEHIVFEDVQVLNGRCAAGNCRTTASKFLSFETKLVEGYKCCNNKITPFSHVEANSEARQNSDRHRAAFACTIMADQVDVAHQGPSLLSVYVLQLDLRSLRPRALDSTDFAAWKWERFRSSGCGDLKLLQDSVCSSNSLGRNQSEGV